jgi:hypothetical protein
MKKVIVEFTDIEGNGTITLSEKECIEKTQKILMGVEPFPLADPRRPYIGTFVKITCENTSEMCSVWNNLNVNYNK